MIFSGATDERAAVCVSSSYGDDGDDDDDDVLD